MKRIGRRIVRWLEAVLGRRRLEREMSAEMKHHLDLEIEDRIGRGMTPAEARRTALRDFGGVERWKEEARAARGLGGWDALGQDLRYAGRSLRNAPGFAAVAVLTLALGIGATTAVFSVVDGLLLEPLGYPESERLVRLFEFDFSDEGDRGTSSYDNFHDLLAQSTTLVAGAAYDEYEPTLRADGETTKVPAASVNAAYFDVLGLRPALGRFFLPEEDEGGSSKVVLSWGLWRERFGGDPDVLGRVLDLNGFPYEVVGVAPPFEDPQLQGSSFEAPRLWRSTPSYFATNGRGGRSFTGIARLAPGATLEEAQAELSTIYARLVAEYPESNAGHVTRAIPLKDTIVGEVGSALWILMGAVALVLLIACANVANLLLFRAAGRTREIALRTALGASRGRIVRQLLTESALLAVLGAAGGIGVALLAMRGLLVLAAGQLPRTGNVGLDPGVLAFAAGVTALAAVVFGLLPAFQGASVATAESLKEGGRGATAGRGHGRLRSAVVAAEVALAVVVLLGAGLLTRSLLRLQAADPGLATEGILTLRIDPPYDPYDPDADGGAHLSELYSALTGRVEAAPGVESAALVDILPMSGSFNGNSFRIEGRPEPAPGQVPGAETRAVGPGYFETHAIPLIEGRVFEERDGLDAPRVAIANRAWVERHMPESAATGGSSAPETGGRRVGERRSAIGERERSEPGPLGTRLRVFDPEGEPYTIIGVVGDVAQFTLGAAPEPTLYFPLDQSPVWMRGQPYLIVRAAGEATAVAADVRRAIADVDPRIPVYRQAGMDEVIAATIARPRFRTFVLLGFAILAFVLAAIGVYGMVAYSVASRLPELGVRMAMGADAGRIRRLVVSDGLRPVLAGAAVGLAVGIGAVQLLRGLLYGVSATDPVTLIAVPALLTAVAALAAWLPARRAARMAPTEVLRGG